jgi:hypothetical protein
VAIRTLHMPIGSISSQSSHCPRNPGCGWKVLSPQGSHGVSGSARPGQSINQASKQAKSALMVCERRGHRRCATLISLQAKSKASLTEIQIGESWRTVYAISSAPVDRCLPLGVQRVLSVGGLPRRASY